MTTYTPSQLAAAEARKARHIRMGMIKPKRLAKPPRPVSFVQAVVEVADVDAAPVRVRCNRPFGKPSREITAQVCDKHGVTLEQIRADSRIQVMCRARHELCWRLRTELALSLAQIGRIVGLGDHTSVRNGVMKHETRMRAPLATVGSFRPIGTLVRGIVE